MFTRKGLAGFGEREMLGRTQGGAHGGGVLAKIIRYSRWPLGLGFGSIPDFRISYISTYVARM